MVARRNGPLGPRPKFRKYDINVNIKTDKNVNVKKVITLISCGFFYIKQKKRYVGVKHTFHNFAVWNFQIIYLINYSIYILYIFHQKF